MLRLDTQIYSDGSKIFMTFEGTSQNPGEQKKLITNVGVSKHCRWDRNI